MSLFCKMADGGLWVGLISLQDGTIWHRTMQRGGVRLAAILRYERQHYRSYRLNTDGLIYRYEITAAILFSFKY